MIRRYTFLLPVLALLALAGCTTTMAGQQHRCGMCAEMKQSCPKCLEIKKDCPKCLEMKKECPKCLEMKKKCPKCLEMKKAGVEHGPMADMNAPMTK